MLCYSDVSKEESSFRQPEPILSLYLHAQLTVPNGLSALMIGTFALTGTSSESRGTAYLAQAIESAFSSVLMPSVLQFLVPKTHRLLSHLHDSYRSLEKSGNHFLGELKN